MTGALSHVTEVMVPLNGWSSFLYKLRNRGISPRGGVNMNRLFPLLAGFGIMAALLTLMVSSGLAQFPDPKDEGKLYELARKEGTLVTRLRRAIMWTGSDGARTTIRTWTFGSRR